MLASLHKTLTNKFLHFHGEQKKYNGLKWANAAGKENENKTKTRKVKEIEDFAKNEKRSRSALKIDINSKDFLSKWVSDQFASLDPLLILIFTITITLLAYLTELNGHSLTDYSLTGLYTNEGISFDTIFQTNIYDQT
jgi:hypothetical protein